MQAIQVTQFGGPQVLQLAEIPLPQPGFGQLRVRLHAAGVNPVDTYIRSGSYAMGLPSLPYTPGTDGAGEVDAVGEGVQRLRPGQRVFVAAVLAKHNTGTYAQYVVCDEDAVHPLPASLSFGQGAALGTPGLAAYHALFGRAGLRPGQKVLVHGASGGVGTLAVQLARRAGGQVYGTAGSAEGLSLLQKLGVSGAFNHRQPGYEQQILEATGGVDVILEMLADQNLQKDMDLLAKYGQVVIVGSRGELHFSPRLAMTKEADIHGMTLGNMPHNIYVSSMYGLAASLETGLQPVLDAALPLSEAPLAHQQVLQKSASKGKLVLNIP